MHLYNLTLQDSSSIDLLTIGCFTGRNKQQEVCVSKNGVLEILWPNPESEKVVTICKSNTFGNVRSLKSFRLTGSSKDYIVIGTDSGKINILEYNDNIKRIVKVIDHTFGRSGTLRDVAGQYIAIDPRGRAIMAAANDTQRLAYLTNRDSSNTLTLSSPLDFSHSSYFVTDIEGIDVGFDNPIFAVLEIGSANIKFRKGLMNSSNIAEELTKYLTFYEVDIGLNTVVRKARYEVDISSNKLMMVPGGLDGPGGVLVCSNGKIQWFSLEFMNSNKVEKAPFIDIPLRNEHLAVVTAAGKTTSGQSKKRKKRDIDSTVENLEDNDFYKMDTEIKNSLGIPREDRGTLIANAALHKLKKGFFMLLQTEYGDIFKITFDYLKSANGTVNFDTLISLKLKYFDTIPTSIGINIFKSGYLFSASEFGNHLLYQIDNLGDDDEEQRIFSSDENDGLINSFDPRPLRNIHIVEEIPSMNAVVKSRIVDLLEEDSPQVISACGQGSRSTLRISKHGLSTTDLAESELPGYPKSVFTCKKSINDEYDSYMVFSFDDATLILEIGDSIEEVNDSGIVDNKSTISLQQMGENNIVQVTHDAIYFINTETKDVIEWNSMNEIGKNIIVATANREQLVVGLSDGLLVYFSINGEGELIEFSRHINANTLINEPGNKLIVTGLSILELPEDKKRTKLLAVALSDNSLCIVNIDENKLFTLLSRQNLSFEPVSIVLSHLINDGLSQLYLHVGLKRGILFRINVDYLTGSLSDTRVRLIGSDPVYLNKIVLNNKPMVLVISDKIWISFYQDFSASVKTIPIRSDHLSYATGLNSGQCPDSIIGISKNSLKILNVDGSFSRGPFSEELVKLEYTPRKFIIHPQSKNIIVIASDSKLVQPKMEKHMGTKYRHYRTTQTVINEETGEEEVQKDIVPMSSEQFGHINSLKPTDWVSKIYIISPTGQSNEGDYEEDEAPKISIVNEFDLDNDENAVSIGLGVFYGHDETYVIVGTVVGLDPELVTLSSLTAKSYIRVYEIDNEGKKLTFVHKTEVEDLPLALSHFQGRLLVGLGNKLRIYDLGKKQLLRKAETRNDSLKRITSFESQGNRIVVSDSEESISFYQYRSFDNKLVAIADDSIPRHITSFVMVDYNTVCASDRFGNIFTLRLSETISDEIDNDPTGVSVVFEKKYLNGANYRLEKLTEYHLGDVITGMEKTNMIKTGREVVAYTTLLGRIGILIPFLKKKDIEFFQVLEIHMRAHLQSLSGRDNLSYRSSFIPIKSCIDGDLCEQYIYLSVENQQKIANILDKPIKDVAKKIEDMRNRSAF